MAEKKITKKMVLSAILGGTVELPENCEVTVEDVVAYAQHEIELLDNKKAKSSSKSKSNENAQYFDTVTDFLATCESGQTPTQIIVGTGLTKDGVPFSTQKMTAVLKGLIENGSVAKYTEKGKTLYKLA